MNYRARITVLSPVHIGTGDVLLKNYDFVPAGERTWVLDQQAILAAEYDASGDKVNWQRLGRPAGELVNASALRLGSPLVRYGLAGTTLLEQVREQVKDVFGQCYLPGSSLKGALRSALFSHAVRAGAFQPNVQRLGGRPKWEGQAWRREWAGQPWEREVFGPDPNHDLLRALVVADSAPLSLDPSPLMLLEAQVFTGGAPGSPIAVEAIRRDTAFVTTLHVDEYLLTTAGRQLGFAPRREWLEKLPVIVNDYSRARIAAEREFMAGRAAWATTRQFYDNLAGLPLPAGGCLLQIGWGVGWSGKSVGPWLPTEMQQEIRRRYSLGRPPRFRGDWRPDMSKPFPKSRRLRARRAQGHVVADVPLGWVLLELQPEEKR